jgi:hypothetical protein
MTCSRFFVQSAGDGGRFPGHSSQGVPGGTQVLSDRVTAVSQVVFHLRVRCVAASLKVRWQAASQPGPVRT